MLRRKYIIEKLYNNIVPDQGTEEVMESRDPEAEIAQDQDQGHARH